MNRPALEVADVLRAHGSAYLEAFGDTLSPAQRRALHDLALCRTAALGGHVEACDTCGQERIAYNSCRNRHCPKCQAGTRARWLEERQAELLPVDYVHVVFTLPHQLAPLALQNQRALYGMLFRAAAETLLQVAADPRHLGAEIGCVLVLHTWGQNLLHHPHVHGVVPAGGLSADASRWVSCPPRFFLPVDVLSAVFRGKFLSLLEPAYAQGQVACHGQLTRLGDPRAFRVLLAETTQTAWVVYAKPPFGGSERVLQYLARYTHRVAISNHRLVEMKDGQVSFRWKDYAHGQVEKVMTLEAFEFIRRFLLHVVPTGLVRVRHYGLLANRHRQQKLTRCRQLLGAGVSPAVPEQLPKAAEESIERLAPRGSCPSCQQGRMVIVQQLARDEQACDRFRRVPVCNTS
jgi:putative transposase/transposase-like zinc-binding protein